MHQSLAYILGIVLILTSCTHTTPTPDVPTIAVGIMQADTINITELDSLDQPINTYSLTLQDVTDSLIITPTCLGATLQLDSVMIGIGFHWQQHEPQRFEGRLRILNHNNRLLVINDIDIESYLESVISSEMNAQAPAEFLRAHAIVSRSWLLSQLQRHHTAVSRTETPGEITVWYDRDDHTLFDVCADDHCQRYQGISRRTSRQAIDAVKDTRGIVLTYNDTVCDARFAKCCGGITEEFPTCWEPTHHPYLQSIPDTLGTPHNILCANPSPDIIATVLNDYDRTTNDFYRWHVTYRADSLGDLFARRSGHNLGYIKDLIPLQRGKSGRISRLKIIGNLDSLIVGKELEIRRTLSPTHLYSSAFEPTITGDGPAATIRLDGAGWGHGVGMCQIGAAVMASQGATAHDILSHYYPGAAITQLY